MTTQNDTYTSPLATRNASPEMCTIWSPRHKFTTWRKIWLAVATAQKQCGLDISDEQLAEMRANIEVTDDDLELAAKYERELRHDVMAHVHAWGDKCPNARPIIHLGCTSQDVVCNADLMIQFQAIKLTNAKIARATLSLADSAVRTKRIPTLGFTHYQTAQPTTVGRRIAGWANDLYLNTPSNRDEYLGTMFRLRGFGGATGTQASFYNLFENNSDRVDRFEIRAVTSLLVELGVLEDQEAAQAVADIRKTWMFSLMGQTYPRSHDAALLASLATVASVLHKTATDIRLLSNRKELDEPFGKNQIGSSAMPYKRNPMKCERICGLSRFVMNLVGNAYDTAATQWLERTLDDSSNRRLSLPESFLALDGALDLMHQVASGLVVNEAMVRKNLMDELPFLATENILMEAVKAGGDRQDLHEKIRVHAQAAGHRVKQEGLDNDLIERLKSDESFATVHHLLTPEALLDPMQYVGRSVEQTERFIADVVAPLRENYARDLASLGSSDRGV